MDLKSNILTKIQTISGSLASKWSLASLRHSLSALRNISESAVDTNGTCVIMSHSRWRYQILLEGMLGAALRMAGWKVIVLTSNSYQYEQRTFRCFGLSDFLYLEDFDPVEKHEDFEVFYLEQVKTCRSISDFLKLQYHQRSVGCPILTGALRGLKKTDNNYEDPAFQRLLRIDTIKTLTGIHVGERIAETISPKLVLINEANYAFHGAFVDAVNRHGIEVIQFLQTNRDDGLLLKRITAASRRSHPSSLSEKTWNKVLEEKWTQNHEDALSAEWEARYGGTRFLQTRDQPDPTNLSPEEIRNKLGVSMDRKLVCVFVHVLWDTNLFYGDDLYEDFTHWLKETAAVAARVTSVDWIFKLHPANHWKVRMEGTGSETADSTIIHHAMNGIPPHVHVMEPRCGIGTRALISAIDAGVTVRGTIGMELPCFGVPVLTAGTGRYSGLGFTIDSNSRAQYVQRLETIDRLTPLSREVVLLAKKYAHTTFLRRTWMMKSFRSDFSRGSDKGGQLHWDLEVVDPRPRQTPWEDMTNFSNWAAETGELDYLAS